MRFFKILLITFSTFISAGCASLDCKPNKATVLPGTNTAIVGIYIDKNGFPQPTVDTVVVRPGQKIIFSGPDRFEIFFKDQRTPIEKLEVQSNNGIVIIDIPKDIFERQQRAANIASTKEILYKYGIRANGKETDPTIRVDRN